MNLFYSLNKKKSSTLGQPLTTVLPVVNEDIICWFPDHIQPAFKAFEKLSKIEYFINNIRLNLTSESFSGIIHNNFTKTMNFIKNRLKDSGERSKVYSMIVCKSNSQCFKT